MQHMLAPLRRKYENVLQKVDDLREKLISVQDRKASNPHDQNLIKEEQDVKMEFLQWNRAAVSFMNQITKETWLTEGDVNTKMFYYVMKRKHY